MECLPGEPLLSRDNLASMTVPNVASGQQPGLAELGITPAALEAVLPLYLAPGSAARRGWTPGAPATDARRINLPIAHPRRADGCVLRAAPLPPVAVAMKLYIGNNKNYSSWSMRSGVLWPPSASRSKRCCCASTSAPARPGSARSPRASPTRRVPVLVEDDGFTVGDAGDCRIHRRPPPRARDLAARQSRARARSLCAEMHAGFTRLRTVCPMNCEAFFPTSAPGLWTEDRRVLRADVARLDAAWSEALAASGGPYLFGAFGAVDAFFAPVARLSRFSLPLSERAGGLPRCCWRMQRWRTGLRTGARSSSLWRRMSRIGRG
jgi:glutathione S-transferase